MTVLAGTCIVGMTVLDVVDTPELTPRQREVFALVVEGLSYADIARRLRLSRRTVENHRAAICRRLDLAGSHALLRAALRHAGGRGRGDHCDT